jgi:hypothetical protein
MSNRQKIYSKGRIQGPFTAIRHEVLNSRAWKNMNSGARLLYIALLRRLSFNAYNNGKVFLATRKAADELGASQRVVCIWFRELEHYGFTVETEAGSLGPKGRATRWRITDMEWGELDGKPIKATKDYLHWTGELFDRGHNPNVKLPKNKRLNSEQKYSHRGTKVLTTDDQKYSPPLASDDRKYSEGGQDDREQKYSDLALPSPIGEAVPPASTSDDGTAWRIAADDWRRDSKTEAERLHSADDDLSIPEFLRRTVK